MAHSTSLVSPAPTLGFIGLGRIGRPMALRLASLGQPMVVHDVQPQATQGLPAHVKVAASVQALAAEAELVFACLQTAEQYRQVVLGPGGLTAGGRTRVYVHLGTTGRACVEALADGLRAQGIGTVDAPMSGGVAGAEQGRLVTMAAGPREAFEAVQAALASWSRKVVHLGEQPGLAQVMKLVNNMLSAANLAMAAEVMVIGAKAGIPASTMLEVLNHGTGQNSATLTKIPDNIVPRRFDCGSPLSTVLKDLSAYAEEARASGWDSDLCRSVLGAFERAGCESRFDDDISTVVRPVERAVGAELGGEAPPALLVETAR